MRKVIITALLSFNAGFLDAAGFLGLQGLFTAHVTGNFVTLGAALVFGTHGIIAKVLALPEFIIVLAMARLAETTLTARQMPTLRILLVATFLFLIAFFVMGVVLGPFPDSDTPMALGTGFMGIAAMAIQNGVQRVHFGNLPPTTIMTGNTTQATIDAVDLLRGVRGDQAAEVRARLHRTIRAICFFAAGCAFAAFLFVWIGFWSLALPVAVGAASVIVRLED